jgi:exodeoxyribonuclease V beta subunit
MTDFATKIKDPDLNLCGGLLVEASAGTGKTYNIQNVYLRLVAIDGLRVQNILVVTFTEAATQELRDRLRQILRDCERFLAVQAGHLPKGSLDQQAHDRIAPILNLPLPGSGAEADRKAEQRQRIRRALADFDSAAIFTIHGFCNRVLARYAFECGTDPDAELIPETTEIIADVCRDWWRRGTYGDPESAAQVPFENVGELVNLVSSAIRRPDAVLRPEMPKEERDKAKESLIEVVRKGLGAMPHVEATNIESTKIERQLQIVATRHPENSTFNQLDLRRLVSLIDKFKDKPLNWNRPDPNAEDIDLDGRLPGAIQFAEAALCAIRADMADTAQTLVAAVSQSVRGLGAITYDAMLTRVRDALRDPKAGKRLQQVLCEEFKAALIDEFQDTDPVQYETFRALFMEAKLPLLLVGDPKQSIYGFRSGDIFTYYGAKAAVGDDRVFSLTTNFRSELLAVAAVNEFFQGGENDRAFKNDHITYEAIKANDVNDAKKLTIGAPPNPDPKPMKVWAYPAERAAMPGEVSSVALQMLRDVADEVVRLLNDSSTRIGKRRVCPSDIAILVHTHKEAARFQRALAERGVNAVRQATDSVFDSREAEGLALVMAALLEPNNKRTLSSALCSGLLPCPIADIRRFNSSESSDATQAVGDNMSGIPNTLEGWVTLFKSAGERWRRYSFIEAFRELADRVGLFAHLACSSGDDAAERLAAVQHLIELAHQAAAKGKLAPTALYRWFVRQTDEAVREKDESFNVRPSSDDAAVKIMTVFKCKGLEFPIVFVPTLWRRKAEAARQNDLLISYHEANSQTYQRVVDLEREKDKIEQALGERLEEDIRLAYVALTRAVNLTYLLTVDLPPPRARRRGQPAGTVPPNYAIAFLVLRWRDWLQRQDPATSQYIEEIQKSVADEEPEGKTTCYAAAESPQGTLQPVADGHAKVDKRFGHASFTALATHGAEPAAGSARDIDGTDADVKPALVEKPSDIFLLPRGAKTGDCLHSLFETLDFRAPDAERRQVIDEALDRFRLCRASTAELEACKRDAVHHMVESVLRAKLPPQTETGSFSLSDIPMSARRSELTFHFPLRRGGQQNQTSALAEILDLHWTGPARNETFLSRLKHSQKVIPMGFMTGSIDLLFERAGRFYIVDWKSNSLDGFAESFDKEGLAAEMAASDYYLQYLIYTVAVDGFLRQSLAGYDYERHFGGIFYLFLRGIDRGHPGRGIVHDRPSAACVQALANELM